MRTSSNYLKLLNIDEQDVKKRLAFFELGEEDFKCLASLKDFAVSHTKDIVEDLYKLILGHTSTKAFFPDERTVVYVKKMQSAYFLELFSGTYDLAYVENRLNVGAVHERIGMPPKWYLGAYRRYLQLIEGRLQNHFKDKPGEADKAIASIRKIIFFDMALAIDTYVAAYVETTTRHQAAIRELSTPVIKVYDRVLLLPIVGTIDTQRAQQIMEAVLTKIVQEQAKVIILDISGVSVVDTKVADHLIKTTASVKLLGAHSILTGISAGVAKTVVQLGVDISGMDTSASLAEGIELALDIIGKKITSKKTSSEE